MATRMRIHTPVECDCCEVFNSPRVYKRIAVINCYFVECDNCLTRSRYFELIEDAIAAWDNGDVIRPRIKGEVNYEGQ